MNYDSQYTKAIIIKNRKIIRQLIISEITHIICESYICDIYTLTDKYTTTRLLKALEKELDKFNFIRIHNNILINAKHLSYIDKDKNIVILNTNIELPFSVRRWKDIKSRLQKFD
ncbi:MAG: LytTR family transcriptional regulator DNA-binding domain-containing protein [Prevotellaceae bacterium]|jgi:DNA-binding LytR/AlgR family response regulator|nr:LytTR family transcriptional regulator DNA-binding domain-containing protein [Prevotellaceae bacterium]